MENSSEKHIVKIQRLLDAPIELVWQAWTTAEHIVRWWSPKGTPTHVENHDFIEGGHWKYIMVMPNGKEFIAEGTYLKIRKFAEILSSADFKPMTEGVKIQALFKKVENKTEFTFNIIHPTEAYKIQQEKMGIQNGWGSVFDRLENLLKNIS